MKRYLPIIIVVVTFSIFFTAHASTNILDDVAHDNHWAWNDDIGWIDFYTPNTITVSATGLTGYASSSIGPISLDCHTPPGGGSSICGTSPYQVTMSPVGSGDLTGWAWNDTIGWISFSCANTGTCGTVPYGVVIDSGGNFQNWAWNDVVGWIDFNCDNVPSGPGSCSASTFEVQTSWVASSATGTLDSTIFDTGVSNGAQLDSVMWQGIQPIGTSVGIQLAVSNSSGGPWNFTGPGGSTSTADVWNPGAPGTPLGLSNYTQYNNYRYFRYRVILTSNAALTATPQVNDVVVTWSP